MDDPKVIFSEFKFDPEPFVADMKMFDEIKEQHEFEDVENSKEAFNMMDSLIAKKTDEYIQIGEEMKKVAAENNEMQLELDNLKKEHEQLTAVSANLKEAFKNTVKMTVGQTNEEHVTLTQKIQQHLGFKLKLQQCPDTANMWSATFLFDVPDAAEGSHFVTVFYDAENDSFTLRDMSPRPSHYADITNILATTNDINGFLCMCRKFFYTMK